MIIQGCGTRNVLICRVGARPTRKGSNGFCLVHLPGVQMFIVFMAQLYEYLYYVTYIYIYIYYVCINMLFD